MSQKLKKILIIGLSLIMVVTTALVGGLFINKNNDNEFSDGSSNDVSQETTPINPIYYASPTEATGASEASIVTKGSLIYVESGATVTISDDVNIGGSLDKKYGGAVYVEAGGTFNMTGGTISGCSSKLGGAIYVEAGGTFNMTGGTISENSAELGAAIYVEPDGIVNISGSSQIINNIEGEWGYLEFDGVKYRDFDHFYNTFDVSKFTKDSFNFNIYGTVYQEYKDLTSNSVYRKGLNFETIKPVNFTGCYDENITDINDEDELAGDRPTIICSGTYESMEFNTTGSDLTFSNITFDDIVTNKTGSWESWYFRPICNKLTIENCVFNEGLNICRAYNANITGTTFDSVRSGHYSLWIGAKGRTSYSTYKDYIEDCNIIDCTFTGYRAIKLLSDKANVYLNSVDFVGMSQKHAIVAEDINVSGAVNELHLSDVNLYDCSKGFIDGVSTLEYEGSPIGLYNTAGYFDTNCNIYVQIYLDDYSPESEKEFVTSDMYVVNCSSAVNFYENGEQTGFWYWYNENTYSTENNKYLPNAYTNKLYLVSKVAGDKWGNFSAYDVTNKTINFRINEPNSELSSYSGDIYNASAGEDSGAGEGIAETINKTGIIVSSGETYTLSDGRKISDEINMFGGAVYVASGGTFNMTGGTITGNNAKYGGAIYVEAGGTCNITGGTIEGNKAEIGAAIYVEDGGTLNIADNVTITGNIQGEWGCVIFNGYRVRNLEDVYKIIDEETNKEYFNFDFYIYGRVYNDYGGSKNPAHKTGLHFGTEQSDIRFIGGYYSETSKNSGNDDPTIIAAGTYESSEFNATGSNLTFENITFDDIVSNKTGSWETWYFRPICDNLTIENCVFNEGLNICKVYNANITGTTFNSVRSSHYSLWIGANGYKSYASYYDFIETCTITDCVFTGYRALKVLSTEAHIVLKGDESNDFELNGVEFNGLTQKHAIVAEDINVVDVYNTFSFTNVRLENCAKGFVDVGNLGVLSGNYIQYYYQCENCGHKEVKFESGQSIPDTPECSSCGYPNIEFECGYCGYYYCGPTPPSVCPECDEQYCPHCGDGYLVGGECSECTYPYVEFECGYCGYINVGIEEPEYCDSCGWPYCPHCGKGNDLSDTYCKNCGFPDLIWICKNCGEEEHVYYDYTDQELIPPDYPCPYCYSEWGYYCKYCGDEHTNEYSEE